jgi:phospholipid transport system transporter-binding protein
MVLTDQELSLRNVVAVSEAGIAAIQAGAADIDVTALKNVDSSAVVAMLAWQRCAQAMNQTLHFIAVPASLISLISLYGMDDFFDIQHLIAAERH